jgi:hypothetical protein
MPQELLVINGTFAVKSEGNDKFLQLPGEPLDTFGFMLGADVDTVSGSRICSLTRI